MEDERRGRFEEVFRAHYGRVLRYARRRVLEEADAQDAVAEVFTVAWRRLEDLPEDALPWLLGTARRVMANHRRTAGRREGLQERVAAEVALAARADPDPAGSGSLAEGLARLSELEREALLLTAWEGLDRRAGARAMGCSVAAFAARLHRARARLADHLEGSTPRAGGLRADPEESP